MTDAEQAAWASQRIVATMWALRMIASVMPSMLVPHMSTLWPHLEVSPMPRCTTATLLLYMLTHTRLLCLVVQHTSNLQKEHRNTFLSLVTRS